MMPSNPLLAPLRYLSAMQQVNDCLSSLKVLLLHEENQLVPLLLIWPVRYDASACTMSFRRGEDG